MTINIGKLKDEQDLHADEVRILRCAEGNPYRILMQKIHWRSYDILCSADMWTEEELLAIQQEDAARMNKSLEDYFPTGISYMHSRLNEATQDYLAQQNT